MRRAVIIAAVLLLLIVAGVAWLAHLHGGKVAAEAEPDTVRVVVYDTVMVVTPAPAQTTPLPGMVVRLPLWRGTSQPDTSQKSQNLRSNEALVLADSADVVAPIERKVYEDSTYRAVISGAWVSLDTMQVYPRREVVTIRQPPDKRKRWGIGISAGYGMTPHGLQPFVGLTATYNIILF